MEEGRVLELEGGPLSLPPGPLRLQVAVDPPDGYAGDLSVRTHRAWPLVE